MTTGHPSAIADVLHSAGVTLLERGWLSANNIVIRGDGPTAMVDSGYATHAPQTLALVRHSLGNAPLSLLLNTHLHSDHCGGNAALQNAYPDLRTLIPPGEAQAVTRWDEAALSYRSTGQVCPRFLFDDLLLPGSALQLGSHEWEVHGAKGHDPHSVVLFLRSHRLLLSADALWENGFGVVFPELEGESAFSDVANTLDLIEELAPETVIPGHGPAFQDVEAALARARTRLLQFQTSPAKHLRYALKVLLKFKLLEWQRIRHHELLQWAAVTPYIINAMGQQDLPQQEAIEGLLKELEFTGALRQEGNWIINT